MSLHGAGYISCFSDFKSMRMLPKKHKGYTIEQCRLKAREASAPFFGLQYWEGFAKEPNGKSECFLAEPGDDDLDALSMAYPVSDNCRKDLNGMMFGGSLTNALYYTDNKRPCPGNQVQFKGKCVQNCKAGLTRLENGKCGGEQCVRNAKGYCYYGCYSDDRSRGLDGGEVGTSKGKTLEECRKIAIEKGATVFGMQDWGINGQESAKAGKAQCFYGKKDQNISSVRTKYPMSRNCEPDSYGNLFGGSWTNAIYGVENPVVSNGSPAFSSTVNFNSASSSRSPGSPSRTPDANDHDPEKDNDDYAPFVPTSTIYVTDNSGSIHTSYIGTPDANDHDSEKDNDDYAPFVPTSTIYVTDNSGSTHTSYVGVSTVYVTNHYGTVYPHTITVTKDADCEPSQTYEPEVYYETKEDYGTEKGDNYHDDVECDDDKADGDYSTGYTDDKSYADSDEAVYLSSAKMNKVALFFYLFVNVISVTFV